MRTKNRLMIIFGIISVIKIILVAAWIVVHRNVIRAWINHEEIPPKPEGHPFCCKSRCCTAKAEPEQIAEAKPEQLADAGL